MKTTKHGTGCKMAFGRVTQQQGICARCDELRQGAPARKAWGYKKRESDAAQVAAIRAHNCQTHGCMSVCVFGDW